MTGLLTCGRVVAAICVLVCAKAIGQTFANQAFPYQGYVTQNGAPMNGSATVQFSLWKDPVSTNVANRIGTVHTISGVPVNRGVFSAVVNSLGSFGVSAFNGEARWLDVAVNGTTILPRTQVLSVPLASGLVGGAAGSNNSSLTSTLTLSNLNTAATLGGAPSLFLQRGSASGISLSTYYPAALRADSANVNGVISTTSAAGMYSLFGWETGANGYGVVGRADGTGGVAVWGSATSANGTGVMGQAPLGGYAGYFQGRGYFSGNVGIGGATPGAPLEIQVTPGQSLQFRFDQSVPGMNVNTAGGNAGIMRLRNSLEIWPSDDGARPGRLDVRNTGGGATIVLDGATGTVSAANMPGVAYAQTFRDPEDASGGTEVSIPANGTAVAETLNVNVPGPGFLVFSASANVVLFTYPPSVATANRVYLRLEDTTSGGSTLLADVVGEVQRGNVGATDPAAGNRQTLVLSWVVPVGSAGLRTYRTVLRNPSGAPVRYLSTSLHAIYVPRGL